MYQDVQTLENYIVKEQKNKRSYPKDNSMKGDKSFYDVFQNNFILYLKLY